MGKGTIIGIIVGFGALLLGFTLEEGNIMSLFLLSPAVIVIGGTIGALMVSYSVSDVTKMPKLIKEAASKPVVDFSKTLETMVDFATIVKKEGLLVLEETVKREDFAQTHDPIIIKGVDLMLENADKTIMKEVLENDVYVFEELKKREIAVFESAGGLSPTLGIIGTVLGLIQVLANMGSPEELAASIAVAFVATLYGVCLANLVYLPIANKLKLRLSLFMEEKGMIIDGLLAIHDFESPSVIKGRLSVYLNFGDKAKDKAPAETKEVREADAKP